MKYPQQRNPMRHAFYPLELARLRAVRPSWVSLVNAGGLLVVAGALALYLWTLARAFGAPLPAAEAFGWALYGVIVVPTFLHFALVLRALGAGTAAVTRDKRSAERWDALVMTGVSARVLVYSWVWAVVRVMAREFLALGVLRASLICWFGTIYPNFVYLPSSRIGVPVTPPQLVLTWGVLLALTLANLPFTAAVGVLEALLLKRGARPADAFFTRALLVLLAVVPLAFVFGALVPPLGGVRLEALPWGLMDNGLSLGIAGVGSATSAAEPLALVAVGGAALLALYGALTWGTLWLARLAAEAWGMVE